MTAGKHPDPALRLLLEADEETGDKALLVLAGDGPLAVAFAPRFKEVHCHNAYHPEHTAALATVQKAGLANVRCVLSDIPCAARAAIIPEKSRTPENGKAKGIGNSSDTGNLGDTIGSMPSAARYPENTFDCVAFRLGRGTAQVNAVIDEAFRLLKPDGVLIVSGHNQEGIKSFAKRAEAHFGNMYLLGLKSGCRLLRFRKESAEPAEAVEDPGYFRPISLELAYQGGGKVQYLTKPGIFAYRATDPGTALLAMHLPSCAGKSVLDLGCGGGALSLAALDLGAKEVLATDISAIAVACTERNFTARGLTPGSSGEGASGGPSVRTLCADLAEGAQAENGGFDLVLTNPPFHKDGDTDYGLPARILETLSRLLKPGGEAYLVANQFLDYAVQARKVFASSSIIARDQSYSIHHMVKAS